jgi:2-methylisocitrate lyase-like PEP mutase family enzyme
MLTWADKARWFAALHVPGDPLVLFNAWDAGSAKAVAEGGAKAIATGSWSVAAAHGYGDGEGLPLTLALANAERIAEAVELPVTIDFEGGYAEAPELVATNMAMLTACGAIGCNFEDGMLGGEGLHAPGAQAARIAAATRAGGPDFFINARTDLFLKAQATDHAGLVDEAIDRGAAYAEAGASGFFVPGLVDLGLLERLCAAVKLPVNVMVWPGVPSRAEFAGVGVARISHGPGPYRLAMAALTEATKAALT